MASDTPLIASTKPEEKSQKSLFGLPVCAMIEEILPS